MELQVTRDGAKATINRLISVHHQTLKDIREGKRLYKDGEDITDMVKNRVLFEIKQCEMVLDAVDTMKAGDIRKAADLCSQIQEFLGA